MIARQLVQPVCRPIVQPMYAMGSGGRMTPGPTPAEEILEILSAYPSAWWVDYVDPAVKFEDFAGTVPSVLGGPVRSVLSKGPQQFRAQSADLGGQAVTDLGSSVLFAPTARRNLLTNTEMPNGLADVARPANSTVTVAPMPGYDNSLQFVQSANQDWAYKLLTLSPNTAYTFSLVVEMDDGSVPNVGPGQAQYDFTLILGRATAATNLQVTPIGDGRYRVRTIVVTGATLAGPEVGVTKLPSQTAKGFRVTAFQVEQFSAMTDYQKIDATYTGNLGAFNCPQGFLANNYTVLTAQCCTQRNKLGAVMALANVAYPGLFRINLPNVVDSDSMLIFTGATLAGGGATFTNAIGELAVTCSRTNFKDLAKHRRNNVEVTVTGDQGTFPTTPQQKTWVIGGYAANSTTAVFQGLHYGSIVIEEFIPDAIANRLAQLLGQHVGLSLNLEPN